MNPRGDYYGYAPVVILETDDELRERLFYVCGRLDHRLNAEIEVSKAEVLESIAERFNLKRRRS